MVYPFCWELCKGTNGNGKLWPHLNMEVSMETDVDNENLYVLTWIFCVWKILYRFPCAPFESSQ